MRSRSLGVPNLSSGQEDAAPQNMDASSQNMDAPSQNMDATGSAPVADAGSSAIDAGETDTGSSLDMGVPPVLDAGDSLDAAVAMDASSSTVSDAGFVQCQREDASWQTYLKCCEMYNWDPRHGCLAWGPPAPPERDESQEALV